MTSGDLAVPPEPLAVLGLDEPAPDGASYRVVTTTEVAYFSGHVPAMAWQGSNGGKLRTV